MATRTPLRPIEEQESLAERFEEHRTRLRAVANRMLGSPSEADDAVQEAWLRLSRADSSKVENLGAWLTTVVAHDVFAVPLDEIAAIVDRPRGGASAREPHTPPRAGREHGFPTPFSPPSG